MAKRIDLFEVYGGWLGRQRRHSNRGGSHRLVGIPMPVPTRGGEFLILRSGSSMRRERTTTDALRLAQVRLAQWSQQPGEVNSTSDEPYPEARGFGRATSASHAHTSRSPILRYCQYQRPLASQIRCSSRTCCLESAVSMMGSFDGARRGT